MRRYSLTKSGVCDFLTVDPIGKWVQFEDTKELREENERLKTEIDRLRLALSGRTQGFDAESFKAGMLAAVDEAVNACLNRIETDTKTTVIIYEAIKAKAEEVGNG